MLGGPSDPSAGLLPVTGELGGEGYGVVWRKSSAGPVNRSVTQRLQVGGVLRPAGIHQH